MYKVIENRGSHHMFITKNGKEFNIKPYEQLTIKDELISENFYKGVEMGVIELVKCNSNVFTKHIKEKEDEEVIDNG